MKNLRYFPFERNKYFYGKLLSVDDFETEQKYMNDKRRLINRFIHGTGVICGMNTILIDDKTISIEIGIALDFAGREIVIDNPITKKLSMIEGFNTIEDEESNYVYLCIEYFEKEKEPVHNIVNSNAINNVEYNKYQEGYHLYLTTLEPENENISAISYYEDIKSVYWGNGIRIKQCVPKYVQSGTEFDIKIIIENLGQNLPISFKYDLDLTCIQNNKKNGITISFDENKVVKSSKYELIYKLQAINANNVEAIINMKSDSFKLKIGEKEVYAQATYVSYTKLIKEDIRQEIKNVYYKTAMEDIIKNTYQQSIYLSKIDIIQAGSSYIIDSIENFPFKQYLFNNDLAYVMNYIDLKNNLKYNNYNSIITSDTKSNLNNIVNNDMINSGSIILDLGIGGTVGQKFFSNEIVHGLGIGEVYIILGISNNLTENKKTIFGEQDIFNDKDIKIKASLAAKVDINKGTFIIGLKCLEDTIERQVRIDWIALKDKKDIINQNKELTMNIKPDMLNLNIRDTYYFEALIGENIEPRVEWSVKEKLGGTIDENGMYTAPNKVGVYEIIAKSKDYPQLQASTFVVVRDN